MRNGIALATMALAFGWLAPAIAQEPSPGTASCPASPAALPPGLSGWTAHQPITAAANARGLATATIDVGKGADVTLLPTSQVSYVMRPEKPGGSVSHGGLLAFTVAKEGTYRVALGSGAWIDVLRGGKPVTSTAHGHGPACSGVMKMVEFPLSPGRYELQVSANAGETLSLLVAPVG